MNEKYLKLNPEKQVKILRAICEEFTEHSYEDASTNKIAPKAGISKGTLFNYFGCKSSMYQYALGHVLDYFKKYAIDKFETSDFIERCRLLAEIDMKIYQNAPYMLNFFAKIYATDKSSVPADITEKVSILLNDQLEILYAGVDYALFRSDIDATTLMKMIRYTLDGYIKEVLDKIKIVGFDEHTFEAFTQDYNEFLKEMKKIYYRKEVLADVEKL